MVSRGKSGLMMRNVIAGVIALSMSAFGAADWAPTNTTSITDYKARSGPVSIGTTPGITTTTTSQLMRLMVNGGVGIGYSASTSNSPTNTLLISGRVGIGFTSANTNTIGNGTSNPSIQTTGGAAIGYTTTGTAGVNVPANGALISGKLGVGYPTATGTTTLGSNNSFLVNGGAAIGYTTTSQDVPQNGLLVGGKVGIGVTTSAPAAQVEVKPTVTANADYYGIRSGMNLSIGTSTMTNWFGGYIAAPSGTGTITNKYALVTEAGAGKIGIGITNPAAFLDVQAGTAASGNGLGITLKAQNGATGNNNGGNVRINGGANTGTGTYGNVILANDGGYVGIGITNPINGQLEVNTVSAPAAIYGSTYGSTIDNIGVEGFSSLGTGVYGSSTRGTAVIAYSMSGNGVSGSTDGSGNGVFGYSATGCAGFFAGKTYIGGPLGIGQQPGTEMLEVAGNIKCSSVKIGNWTLKAPDYVFDKGYKLPSLKDVEKHIAVKKHLPDIPSEAEMKKNGVDLAQLNMALLKKVEELTLYVIDQNKKIEELKREIARK